MFLKRCQNNTFTTFIYREKRFTGLCVHNGHLYMSFALHTFTFKTRYVLAQLETLYKVTAGLPFRQVQFVSPTVQFSLQEFFSSLLLHTIFFSVILLCKFFFHFSNGPSHIRTLTYQCFRSICSTASQLQSAVENLKRLVLQNGYPQGIITFNTNDQNRWSSLRSKYTRY